MKELTAKDFTVSWLSPHSFYFTTASKLPDGYEICIEQCMSGWDVALYKDGEIVTDKICTQTPMKIEEIFMLMEYGEMFTMTTQHIEALEPALVAANKLYKTIC